MIKPEDKPSKWSSEGADLINKVPVLSSLASDQKSSQSLRVKRNRWNKKSPLVQLDWLEKTASERTSSSICPFEYRRQLRWLQRADFIGHDRRKLGVKLVDASGQGRSKFIWRLLLWPSGAWEEKDPIFYNHLLGVLVQEMNFSVINNLLFISYPSSVFKSLKTFPILTINSIWLAWGDWGLWLERLCLYFPITIWAIRRWKVAIILCRAIFSWLHDRLLSVHEA